MKKIIKNFFKSIIKTVLKQITISLLADIEHCFDKTYIQSSLWEKKITDENFR